MRSKRTSSSRLSAPTKRSAGGGALGLAMARQGPYLEVGRSGNGKRGRHAPRTQPRTVQTRWMFRSVGKGAGVLAMADGGLADRPQVLGKAARGAGGGTNG